MAEPPGGGPDGGSPSGAQPPDDTASVTSEAPPRAAGGLAALAATAAHLNANRALLRGTRALAALNQHHGFDCPGCAWPEPHEHRSDFEFCENGAKAVAWEATSRRADAAFFARHSIAELAAQSDHWLGQQGRLTEPLVRRPGDSHYQPITWDQAFDLLAAELLALPDPDQAVFYTSGRTSNEAAFLYQLFVRQIRHQQPARLLEHVPRVERRGPARDDRRGQGHRPAGRLRAGRRHLHPRAEPGHQPPAHADHAAAGRPARLPHRQHQPAARGRRSAAFRHPQNPLEMLGRGTPIACLHLPVRIGGDVALLKGIAKAMLELDGSVQRRGRWSTGRSSSSTPRASPSWPTTWPPSPGRCWKRRAASTEPRMEQAAEIAATSRRMIACWAMGLTQHRHAVANIQEVVNLLLLGGHFGRPGAGACPVRGHSNVQGDRTMGIFEHVDGPFLDRLEAALRLPGARAGRAWTRWRPSPRWRPGARACSSPWAATSCRPPPTPNAPPPP